MQNFRKPEKRSIDAAALLDDRHFKRPRLSDPGPLRRGLPPPISRRGLGSGFDGSYAERYNLFMPEPGTEFYEGFSDATDQYYEEVQSDVVQHLAAIKLKLFARLEGLDADGHPLKGYAGLPTEQDIVAVETEMRAFVRPLQDDWLKLGRAISETAGENEIDRDGQSIVSLDANFSDIIANLRREFDGKEKELRQLQQLFHNAGKELDSAIRNMLEDVDGATANAERQLANVRRMAIGSLCETADLTIQEVKNINAEEKAAEKKRQGMLRNLLSLTE